MEPMIVSAQVEATCSREVFASRLPVPIMYNVPMPIQWIEHKGVKILLIDVSNLENDHAALNAHLETLIALLKTEPRDSVLAVADLRNTRLSNNVITVLMRNASLAAPYFRKSALVIESNNARSIVLDSFKMIIKRIPKRFDDLDAAKAWLVNDFLRPPVDDRHVLKQPVG
jgi:hypothetical protein